MKLAFIIQRYGLEIIGGAEYFTRLVAEHLNNYHTIEIFTTCAKGYHTWENEYPVGDDWINGIKVRRFRNEKLRDMNSHISIQEKVFYLSHTIEEERKWVDEQGPYCPDLIEFIEKHTGDYDYFIFFTYRYYPSMYGIEKVKEKAIIVPFAENDPALALTLTADLFKNVAGIIYSTPEEEELIKNRVKFDEKEKKWAVIGCGIDVPSGTDDVRFSQKSDYLLYIGRIEGSKGCYQLFEYYLKLISEWSDAPDLVLAGYDAIGIPNHNKIKYFGFVPEEKKSSLIKHAKILIMPSPLESFSLVTLESMACGTPVLVNGDCDVLRGHCIRSNAGLWYQNYEEFSEGLLLMYNDEQLKNKMSGNGIKYILNTYSWDVIQNKYLGFFDQMKNFSG